MKGLKRKSVDTKEEVREEIKNETSLVSEFSEEEDNEKTVGFANIIQGDVFEKVQGDNNEKRHDVRKDGQHERRENGKVHDQESKSSGQKEASSKEESSPKSESKESESKESSSKESSSKEEKEVTHFKHGTPKEISVFVTVKVSTLPYENIDISNGITLTLPPNADHATAVLARAEAYEYCENFIALRVTEIRKSLAGAKK